VLYHFYEFAHASLNPARLMAGSAKALFRNPFNPLSHTAMGRGTAAMAELVERTTRRYEKPAFGLTVCKSGGQCEPVDEEIVWERPFCRLLHFRRDGAAGLPRMLVVAPLSGHYATLLRGTVEGLLPHYDVYITDWVDAATVPAEHGLFDLDDYVDYVIDMTRLFDGHVHLMAVCQPSVPALMAVAHMEAIGDPCAPRSLILMGGPIDTRKSPTAVNRLAVARGIEWFRQNAITTVPWPHRGHGRQVYPGFLQLGGFISMNLDRHVGAHRDLFFNLVEGDGDSAEKHREFYDEYLAVMDLTAEFYLQTVEQVFIDHALPKGRMRYRGNLIDPGAIRRVALMTVEGEKDDITGLGQCEAAHRLCRGLPRAMRQHYVQRGVGHYGIFNGSRFRTEIVPRIAAFTQCHGIRGRSALLSMLARLRPARKIEVSQPMPVTNTQQAIAVEAQIDDSGPMNVPADAGKMHADELHNLPASYAHADGATLATKIRLR
jgi:poly(3-hydroxybutyrate) depolymerase